MVKGYQKGASWSFPRGKINKDEPEADCAVREVGLVDSLEPSGDADWCGVGIGGDGIRYLPAFPYRLDLE